jgi:hypothetical protein
MLSRPGILSAREVMPADGVLEIMGRLNGLHLTNETNPPFGAVQAVSKQGEHQLISA